MAKRKPSVLFGGRLSRDAVDAVTRANKIVARGVRKLADRELKAVEDYYATLLGQLDAVKRGENVRDVALQQLDVMRGTVLAMLAHARDSLTIVGDVRKELQQLSLTGEGAIDSEAAGKVIASAEQAWQQVKAEAVAVEAQASSALDTEAAVAPPARKRGRSSPAKPEDLAPDAPRKRGRPPKAKPEEIAPEAPRRRGRPPKAKAEVTSVVVAAKRGRPPKASASVAEAPAETPRKRGRPPRVKVEAAVVEAPRKRGRPPKAKTEADANAQPRAARKGAGRSKSAPVHAGAAPASADARDQAAANDSAAE